MSKPFTTRANDYLLSILTIGEPSVFMVMSMGPALRRVLRNRFLAAPWVPDHWPVVDGDILEVERIGRLHVRVTVMGGKERMDCLVYLLDQWASMVAPIMVE